MNVLVCKKYNLGLPQIYSMILSTICRELLLTFKIQDEDSDSAAAAAKEERLVLTLGPRPPDFSGTPRRVPSLRGARNSESKSPSRRIPLAPSLSARVGEVKPPGNFLGVSTARNGDGVGGRRATRFR
jgi:hypothetical protein